MLDTTRAGLNFRTMKQITLAMVKAAYDAVGGGVEGMLIEKAILKGAFDLVKTSYDWREPIDTSVDETCEFDRDVLARAIEFFTGTTAKFVPRTAGGWWVKADGYRAGPCGP